MTTGAGPTPGGAHTALKSTVRLKVGETLLVRLPTSSGGDIGPVSLHGLRGGRAAVSAVGAGHGGVEITARHGGTTQVTVDGKQASARCSATCPATVVWAVVVEVST